MDIVVTGKSLTHQNNFQGTALLRLALPICTQEKGTGFSFR